MELLIPQKKSNSLQSRVERLLSKDDTAFRHTPVEELRSLVSGLQHQLHQLKQPDKNSITPAKPSANPGCFFLNLSGTVVDINPIGLTMLGISVRELKQFRIFNYIRRDYKKSFSKLCCEVIQNNKSQQISLIMLDGRGNEFPVLLKSSPDLTRDGQQVIKCILETEF